MTERRKYYKTINILFTVVLANAGIIRVLPVYAIALIAVAGAWIYLKRNSSAGSTARLRMLSVGDEELIAFLIALPLTVAAAYALWKTYGLTSPFVIHAVIAFIVLSIVFWSGIIRTYMTSVQLGIRYRVLGIILGWIFPLNIFLLMKIRRTVRKEVEAEEALIARDRKRADERICDTKYPLLLVHGVFFRDIKGLNYWGRIPKELEKNGARIYYGDQQSADSVMDCGKEIADRILRITEETGAEKVNIIAHSKGGLDSRAAITHFGMAPHVATLTTVNTPHRGCVFAEYLLDRMPEAVREQLADAYNSAAHVIGDKEPDFLSAVTDLTASACERFNEETPDADGVLYESVMSYAKHASGSRFPLNMTHELVKHFDGANDGLVAVDSARWGSDFTLLRPTGDRGISHGDVIDLNRENIEGFDVREFYVGLVKKLKDRGY